MKNLKKGRLGIYIHWPFCLSKCPYCDFNITTAKIRQPDEWLRAYMAALRSYGDDMSNHQVVSIYFGGGTPSLMDPAHVSTLIQTVRDIWPVADDFEITLEANPTTAEIDKFAAFYQAGVNRLSLGVQSVRDDALKFLGRLHGRDEVLRALRATAQVFDRYSIDLIYDRPGQTLDEWQSELSEVLEYTGGHISAYQLTIKQGTAFEKQVQRGGLCMSDEGHSADLFEMTQEILGAAGMPSYEVSNYSARGEESRHNLVYWRYDDYIGIGPGAHGRPILDGRKCETVDIAKPAAWLSAVEQAGHGRDVSAFLDTQAQFEEAFMMGLRIYEGCALEQIALRAGGDDWRQYIDAKAMGQIVEEGWAIYDHTAGDHLKLTRAGMMRYNSIIGHLL